MKIAFVKFYQAVKFENSVVSYVSSPKSKDSIFSSEKQAELSIESGVGVHMRSDKDHILVPFNNIVSINFHLEAEEKKPRLKPAA